MTGNQAIVEIIDRSLAEARSEIDRLTAARAALAPDERSARAQDTQAPVAIGTQPRTRAPRRARSRRGAVVPSGKLEALLGATDGMSTSALADQAGGSSTQLLPLLRDLESAGKIRRSGQRRGTRWHLITDEDRIRERAAELEALIQRSG